MKRTVGALFILLLLAGCSTSPAILSPNPDVLSLPPPSPSESPIAAIAPEAGETDSEASAEAIPPNEQKPTIERNDKTGFTPFSMEPDAWMELLKTGHETDYPRISELWESYGIPFGYFERDEIDFGYYPEIIYQGKRKTALGIIEECVIKPSGWGGVRIFIFTRLPGEEWMLTDFADYNNYYEADTKYVKVGLGKYETAFIVASQTLEHGTGVLNCGLYWYNLDAKQQVLFSYDNSHCSAIFMPYDLRVSYGWKKQTPILTIVYDMTLYGSGEEADEYQNYEVFRAKRKVSFAWDAEKNAFELNAEDSPTFRRYWYLNHQYSLDESYYFNAFFREELQGDLHAEFNKSLKSKDSRVRQWAQEILNAKTE